MTEQVKLENIYKYGLLSVFITLFLAGTTEVFDGNGFHILGFIIFLFLWVDLFDRYKVCKNIKHDFFLLLGYAVLITALIYIFYPYAAHQDIVWSYFVERYTSIFAGAAYGPSIILKFTEWFSELSIPEVYTKPISHYPFAVGFYGFYFLLRLMIRFYDATAVRHPAPGLFLVAVFNFVLGITITAIVFAKTGNLNHLCLGMVIASLALWAYWYIPRFGIPSAMSTNRKRRVIQKIGDDIQRSQEKLESYLEDIDKI